MKEILYLMNNYGYDYRRQDLISLFSRFDRNQNSKISYAEFLQEITPKSIEVYWWHMADAEKMSANFTNFNHIKNDCNFRRNNFYLKF